MKSNSCNNENQILDPRKTYLTTHYYKTIPVIDSSGPTFGAQYNYSNYDKFCLNTNLQPIFASIGLTFDINSIKIDDKMVLCVVPKQGGETFAMTEKTQDTLQQEVNFVCDNLYHLCLLFDVLTDRIYPRGWLISIFPHLQISDSLNPTFIKGKLYLSLNESTDYLSYYSDTVDNLMIQISQLYKTGDVICDDKFAKDWNLDLYRDDIYIAKWIDTRITMDKSQFLFNMLSGFPITMNIPDNSLYYHYISKKIQSLLVESGKIQFIPKSMEEINKILEIISIESESIYTITQILLPSQEIYIEMRDKILRKWKSADITGYGVPDPHRPIALSVLILDQVDDLKLKINKLI